jgi:tetratricopeptide (TPR) repeat protein
LLTEKTWFYEAVPEAADPSTPVSSRRSVASTVNKTIHMPPLRPRPKTRAKSHRTPASKAAGSRKPKKRVRATKNAKRFRVAFSFAGEKRDYVRKVANALTSHFKKEEILYDKFHEAEFSRARLGRYLPKLYHEQSELIVVVVCPDYQDKEWCGLEWDAIFDLLKKRREDEVMLTRFGRATVEGLFSDAGFSDLDTKSAQQTADLICERLAVNKRKVKESDPDAGTGTSADSIRLTPNNLPRLQFFFGRDADLKRIADSLAEDARGWGALIDGPGGIGKTSLAIRAAELVPPGRFSRIIFLSSKERELTADGQRSLSGFVVPSYLEILNAIARELDEADLAKTSEAERPSAIVKMLGAANVLLVLDNLETLSRTDRDQLFAFLNRLPRGCSAIVTSRRRADASAVAVRLVKLDWKAAEELLNELATDNSRLRQASTEQRRTLYDETGGNPLLIRWIVGQLGSGRCHDVSTALEFLRSAPPGNDPLEFIFGDLLDSFSKTETLVLAALSHFRAGVETKFIAELASLNAAATHGALIDLSYRALVIADSEEQTFALVPMVADFLRRKKPEVIVDVEKRLEERAYALAVENGYAHYDRFGALDDAWPTIAAALPLFLRGPIERLITVCQALDFFLDNRGRWDELISFSRQAEAKAAAAGDSVNAGWRAIWVGVVQERRDQPNEALATANRAAAFFKDAPGVARGRAWAVSMKGRALHAVGDDAAAVIACREAVELFKTLSTDSHDMTTALQALASVETSLGDFEAAERYYQEALRIAEVLKDRENIGMIIEGLAHVELDRQNWSRAEALGHQALVIAKEVGRLSSIGNSSLRIALALLGQEKYAEALPYAERALDILSRVESPTNVKRAREALQKCKAGTK